MTLRRIFDDYAYGNGPREGCFWDDTCTLPETGPLEGEEEVDVAVIGGGFTGISAALALAEKGVRAAVLEARTFGWGASGRNGGFCCLGGGKASDAMLDARFGRAERLAFRRIEKAAVETVEKTITRLGLEVDRHSRGETQLAHRPKDMVRLRHEAESVFENYGIVPEIIGKADLQAHGMQSGSFHGAMTIPVGFGLNPRKYLCGLMVAARSAGARLFSESPVTALSMVSGRHRVRSTDGHLRADQVIVATNGYSSENLPSWLAGRYMPAQSTVLVTRPLRVEELEAQGWTSTQMSYDTRDLLHYFRLMPDGRVLFGMRGGLLTGPRAERAARARTRADFERMFPAWAQVESTHSWSGMVCLSRRRLPFIGRVPEARGLWTAMCYHGNGVAMASHAGKSVADLVLDRPTDPLPRCLADPLQRFPLGRARRLLMAPLYAALGLQDRF